MKIQLHRDFPPSARSITALRRSFPDFSAPQRLCCWGRRYRIAYRNRRARCFVRPWIVEHLKPTYPENSLQVQRRIHGRVLSANFLVARRFGSKTSLWTPNRKPARDGLLGGADSCDGPDEQLHRAHKLKFGDHAKPHYDWLGKRLAARSEVEPVL